MSNNFNPGDIVLCVKNFSILQRGYGTWYAPLKGSTYTITKNQSGCKCRLSLAEVPDIIAERVVGPFKGALCFYCFIELTGELGWYYAHFIKIAGKLPEEIPESIPAEPELIS